MTSGDSQQSQCRPLWRATILLPIPECMDADAHGTCETGLSQADEASEGGDVGSRLESTLREALAKAGRNGTRELF